MPPFPGVFPFFFKTRAGSTAAFAVERVGQKLKDGELKAGNPAF